MLVNGSSSLSSLFCYDVHICGQWEPIELASGSSAPCPHHSSFLAQIPTGPSLPFHPRLELLHGASTPFGGNWYLDTTVRALGPFIHSLLP